MTTSQSGISKTSKKMLIASLKDTLKRRDKIISRGGKPYLPDEYYDIAKEQIKKYDAKHNRA